MKALEEKIHKIIFSGIKDFSIVSHITNKLSENIIYVSKDTRDIAIEFAKFAYTESLRNNNASKDWNELFDQFIKERYS